MKLKVTNTLTGRVWIEKNSNHSWEKLALEILEIIKYKSSLIYCDIEGLTKMNGVWYILDECGNWEYIPKNYKIEVVKNHILLNKNIGGK